MVPELRARGIGEILDAAVALYRARFSKLVRVAVAVVVPVNVLTALILLSARPDGYSVGITGTASPQYDNSSFAVQFAATVLVFVVTFLSSALVVAVCTRIVADAYVDAGAGTSEAIRTARGRVPAIVGASLLVLVCEVIGFFFCFVGALVPLTLFAVVFPVLILEHASVSTALSRSVALTRRHAGHVLGLVLAAQLLSSVVAGALAEGVGLLVRVGGGTVATVLGQSLANVISGTLTTPFVATAVVVLYFDLRIRTEAFDVQLLMQRTDRRRGMSAA